MSSILIASASIEIQASAATVWKALITPESIKQYLFGTETECDWNVGSPIYFRGEYQGNTYEDKGVIQEIEQEKILRYTYWSSMSGTADIPENYMIVSFLLTTNGNATILTIRQDGSKTEESRKHSEENWGFVLQGLKKVAEGA